MLELLTQQISDGLPFGLLQVTTSLSSECCLFPSFALFSETNEGCNPSNFC
jgi:hypothetical protein